MVVVVAAVAASSVECHAAASLVAAWPRAARVGAVLTGTAVDRGIVTGTAATGTGVTGAAATGTATTFMVIIITAMM